MVEQRVFELDRTFYYYYESDKEIQKGTRALINFNGKELVGFVMEVENYNEDLNDITSKYPGIKQIIKIIDDVPVIDEELFDLAQYMSKRYVCPLISCFQAILPKSLKPSTSSKNAAKPQYFYSDFKKKAWSEIGYKLAREKGIYLQDYCGCEYSLEDSIKRKEQKQASE